MAPLLVCCVAGLSPRLLTDPAHLSGTRAKLGSAAPIRPVFPAVTCTAQATYTTGLPPSGHGIIANGLYDRTRRAVGFWEQAAGLIDRPRLWDLARERKPGAKTACLFWWNGMHSSADLFVNVAPFHLADGRMIPACYSSTPGFYDRLAEQLGPFPLHRFWGPVTSIESSEWIARATKTVMEEDPFDLVLTYLPHLDYNQQKFGPASDAVATDLAELDQVLTDLIDHAGHLGYETLLVSEYGITPVNGAVAINQAFRQQGWIAVREAAGMEFLDIGACRAFAMVDHQVAHIYTQNIPVNEVADCLGPLEGVGQVLTGEALASAGLAHPNCGELVAIADADKWFSYPWWLDPERAPDFARTIDIHRKPGFDPLEMFFDPATKQVPLDTSLVKGSHGRLPDSPDDGAVALASFDLPAGPIEATDICALVINQLPC